MENTHATIVGTKEHEHGQHSKQGGQVSRQVIQRLRYQETIKSFPKVISPIFQIRRLRFRKVIVHRLTNDFYEKLKQKYKEGSLTQPCQGQRNLAQDDGDL